MSLEEWKRKRTPIKSKLTRFRNQFKAYERERGIGTWAIQLTKIEPLYDQFDEIQTNIEMIMDSDGDLEESQIRTDFEEAYFETVQEIRNFLDSFQTGTATLTSNNSVPAMDIPAQSPSLDELVQLLAAGSLGTNLPTIKIPKFDGSCKDWVRFRDSFKTMVHERAGLSPIQKYHYLNDALMGDAARCINSLGVSEANYEQAWQCLVDRFNDPRNLIHFHMTALFELPVLAKADSVALRQLIDDTNNHLQALRSLEERPENWDTVMIYLIGNKLDHYTKREWEKKLLGMRQRPRFHDLTNFLEDHCKYLQRTSVTVTKPDAKGQGSNSWARNQPTKDRTRLTSHAMTTKVCPMCQSGHTLYNCNHFRELSIDARLQKVRELRLCYNCLTFGHINKNCKAGTCYKCQGKHNSLLHPTSREMPNKEPRQIETQSIASEENEDLSGRTALVTHTNHSPIDEEVILGTALIWVYGRNGKRHECRAMLDSGSQVNIITQDLCNRLGLTSARSDTVISGAFKNMQEPLPKTMLKFSSRSSNYSRETTCYVTRAITDDMPNMSIKRYNFDIPEGLVLADPSFARRRPVDMLIGAAIFWNLLCVGQIHLRKDQPILQKTQLGWIVAGPMQISNNAQRLKCNLITNQQLHSSVERFWEIENHARRNIMEISPQDELEQHFLATTTRTKNGRFTVQIPFKENVSELGDSFCMAQKRFFALERKLAKNPELQKSYVEFMADYERQHHMELVSTEDKAPLQATNYLPHHAVMKESSTTTKVRVVFDGSAKTTSGLSFNDVQKIGTVVQSDLFSIVLRFRQHPIVLSADISQMYRQILINQNQRDWQRILWRSDSSQPLQHYRLNTITYGTASAPYLATRALRQVGEENKNIHPKTSRIIIRDFYVDDLLTGANSIKEAQNIKEEITRLLLPYGLELRKWASNEPQVLRRSPLHCKERVACGEKDPKTLGLLWEPCSDQLKYEVTEDGHKRITKRNILSKISQIFDPLGLLGPAIIRAKIILQRLWQLRLDWDEAVTQELHTAWSQFCTQLIDLNQVSAPRFILCQNMEKVQLHGFCDASETAYGACIYARSTDKQGNVTVKLLCGKSRVAPLKKISLPRLELQAALLLAQLTGTVTEALDLTFENKYYWTDSTITLCWIKSCPSRWKTYVANRTSEIQELTNNGHWRHVSSGDNPADLISRGMNPADIKDAEVWWNGPNWLPHSADRWPCSKTQNSDENVPEKKPVDRVLTVITDKEFKLLERFSSLNKLIRVTGYCWRFAFNAKGDPGLRTSGYLSLSERERSLTSLLKLAQSQDFQTEIKEISSQGISNKNQLQTLNPFLDKAGLLRVGGRLVNAPVAYEQRHPVILASGNPLTKLLIIYEHEKLMHAGCQTVMASLRTQFWPLSCKKTVKGILRKCVRCFRTQPPSIETLMGNLPVARVTPSRPFSTCGVDYAGPYYVIERVRSRQSVKVYICIFVCFATKAVHIELARDLSTEAFLNCFYRFVSRRGKCQHIYSDNGTNFVGARSELNELGELLANQEFQASVTESLAQKQITWHMIPPNAPNFGGLWEAAVKSMKRHLRRVIGETRLTFEELYTVLVQVEACLNSRPLSPLSNDPNDLQPLTPGHFLIGDSLAAVPQHDVKDIRENRLNRYQHLQFMFQHFWKRWQTEYLSQLQQRHKWTKPATSQLAPGAMVILREDNLPPLRWRLGRITQLHPGKDNIIRVVSVQVGQSVIKRAITKICLLPIAQ